MIKLLAILNPNQQEYKIVMSYLFAIVAEHLPECQGDKPPQFAVLVLDYLENRDSFTYVQVLDQLLHGRSEKHKILDKIEQIEAEKLGKSKKKVVTIDTGVANKESMPVLLALYHKKKTVKKAALLTLYQQWIENNDISQGKDLRMIVSMLIQFIEERETEDVLIVTFTLLESLLERNHLSEQIIQQLFTCLGNHFIPKHFPPDRQYSIGGYMKGVNLFLNLKDVEFKDLQTIIYTLCSLNLECKELLNKSELKTMLTDNNEFNTEQLNLEKGLELLKILTSRPDLARHLDGKLWSVFETLFNTLLKKIQNDPFLSCLSLIDTLRNNTTKYNPENLQNIFSLFIGKLPSLGNNEREVKERLQVSDILIQAMKINTAFLPIIFETISIKHLNCDLTSIIDYFTTLYHESGESTDIRIYSLAFLKRALNHSSDLEVRTQLLANYFPTFLIASNDPDSNCRKIAMSLLKIYESYDNFTKILKKEKKKTPSVFAFMINKSKIFAIKKGKALDDLEEFIEDLSTSHEAEILADSNFVQNLINLNKTPILFDYLMYAISSSRTPLELKSYLKFLKAQKFNEEQMETFCNVLVSIEFKSSLLSKDLAFQYMPNLIDILCNQDTNQDSIAHSVHD